MEKKQKKEVPTEPVMVIPEEIEITIVWNSNTEKCKVKAKPDEVNGLMIYHILGEVAAHYSKLLKEEKFKIEKNRVSYVA